MMNKKKEPSFGWKDGSSGVRETIRTSDPRLRRSMLCPAELHEHMGNFELSNCKNCDDFEDNFSPKQEQKISIRVYEGCMKRLFIEFGHNM